MVLISNSRRMMGRRKANLAASGVPLVSSTGVGISSIASLMTPRTPFLNGVESLNTSFAQLIEKKKCDGK